jgi:hypothetical protein
LKRQSIQESYRAADGKSGILDRLDNLKNQTDQALKDDLRKWDEVWKKGLVGENGVLPTTWAEAQRQFETWITGVEDRLRNVGAGASVGGGVGGGGGGSGNQDAHQTATIGGRVLELGTIGGSVAPSQQIPNPPAAQVEAFIRQAAPQYQVPGEDAVRVWSGEGRSGYVGDGGTSFGPFQLHVGGGLGDDFERIYKEDIRDPSTWQDQVMYTLGYVQTHGWNGQWHGAPPDLKNKRYDQGGWVTRPSYLVDAATRSPYATIAERAPEMVLSPEISRSWAGQGGGMGSGPIEHLPVNLTFGNQVVEQVWISGYKLLARRGGLPARYGDVP